MRTGRLPVAAVGAPEPAVDDGGVRAGVVPETGTSADGVGSGTMGLWGLKDGEAPGESLGARETGPEAGIGAPRGALHWRGTLGMLQARGRETARVRLIGSRKGTLPVTMRHVQPMLLLVRFLRALQQAALGDVALALLLVRKLKQGVKVVSIAGVHGLLMVCPLTGNNNIINDIKAKTTITGTW